MHGKAYGKAESIQKAFDRWEHKQLDRMNQAEIEAVYQALYPKFEIIPVLWRKIEDQEKRLNRLTSEQSSILEFLSNHNTALIQGIAGSGKTILGFSEPGRRERIFLMIEPVWPSLS